MLNKFNLIANICGFVGGFIVFKFGIPNQIDTGGKIFLLLEQENEEEKNKIAKYRCWSKFGFSLITIGFFLQILGEIL